MRPRCDGRLLNESVRCTYGVPTTGSCMPASILDASATNSRADFAKARRSPGAASPVAGSARVTSSLSGPGCETTGKRSGTKSKSVGVLRRTQVVSALPRTQGFKTLSGERDMPAVKQKMKDVIEAQPEDATYEEIMRELAFERMVERGLADSRNAHVISNEEMEHRIRSWQK